MTRDKLLGRLKLWKNLPDYVLGSKDDDKEIYEQICNIINEYYSNYHKKNADK